MVEVLGQVLAGLTVVVAGFLVLLFRSLRPNPGPYNRNIRTHTRAQVNARVQERMGPARFRLHGMIGDQLDQKSGWIKGMDLILGVLADHPDAVLDFLIETHGEEAVRKLLEERTE